MSLSFFSSFKVLGDASERLDQRLSQRISGRGERASGAETAARRWLQAAQLTRHQLHFVATVSERERERERERKKILEQKKRSQFNVPFFSVLQKALTDHFSLGGAGRWASLVPTLETARDLDTLKQAHDG